MKKVKKNRQTARQIGTAVKKKVKLRQTARQIGQKENTNTCR